VSGDREALLAALAWQVELGADEAIADAPVDRFAAPAATTAPPPAPDPAPHPLAGPARPAAAPGTDNADAVAAEAAAIAAGCADLAALAAALAAFDGCPLKAGARNCVFADGWPGARVMIVGEAPGRDEDRLGRPFVGRSGRLLDRMLAAIGLDRAAQDRERGVYITNMLPWRPLDNRKPARDETAMLEPFVRRHIELAAPDVVLLMGATAAQTLMETATGVMRLRGQWTRLPSCRPALATLHPAYLLRTPAAKRLAWRDLQALRAALDDGPPV